MLLGHLIFMHGVEQQRVTAASSVRPAVSEKWTEGGAPLIKNGGAQCMVGILVYKQRSATNYNQ